MKINILYTSDVHGYLDSRDYINPKNKKEYGLSRVKTIIDEIKKQNENVLYFDNGDILQGSVLATFEANEENKSNSNIFAYNLLGTNAHTLGNHEFNYGLNYLENSLNEMNGDVLCANILNENNEPFIGNAYKIYKIKDIKIGVLGLTTSYIPNWEKPENIKNLKFESALDMANKYIPIMKNDLNCDLIIVIYHGGFEKNIFTGEKMGPINTENQGYAILKSGLPIDVLLTGHQHQVINEVVDDIVVMQVGTRAEFVGNIEINIDNKKINVVKNELIETKHYSENTKFKEFLNPLHEKIEKWLGRKIGISKGNFRFDNFAKAQIYGHPFLSFVNKVQSEYMGTDISGVSLFNLDMPGFGEEITYGDIVNNYPYPNTLCNVKLTGKQFKDILEKNVRYLMLTEDGKIGFNPKFFFPKRQIYHFDIFRGFEYYVDMKKEGGDRVEKIIYKGKKLEEDDEIIITINNFRARGGGYFPHYSEELIIKEDLTEITDIMKAYIEEKEIVYAEYDNALKIVGEYEITENPFYLK